LCKINLKMRSILVILFSLKFLVGFSQDTIRLTGVDSVLIVQLADLMQKRDSLFKLIGFNEKMRDSIFLSISNPIETFNPDYDFQEITRLYKKFETQYQNIVISDNFPSELPIDNAKKHLIAGFGKMIHPIYKTLRFHKGIDIPAEKGTPIIATLSGKVEVMKEEITGYGKHIIISSDESVQVLFAHLDEIYVRQDEFINKGDVIGVVGNTGMSIGNHLHYEIIINGEPINPVFAAYGCFSEAELRLIFLSNRRAMDWLVEHYFAQHHV